MNKFCEGISAASNYVHGWITKQHSVGEESLTDWFLFKLSEDLPEIKYRKFNRHQEVKVTGADWEWWFVDNNVALCLRIQAKKLKVGDDNYGGLAHTNRYGLQIEKLIADAKRNNSIPFYALYSAPEGTPDVLCGGSKESGRHQGVFISFAQVIYDNYFENGRVEAKSKDLLALSNPIKCLLCCKVAPDISRKVEYIYEHIQKYYLEGEEQSVFNENTPGIHSNSPSYVSSLLDLEGAELPDWWEKEFEHQTQGLNAVVVTDLRENSPNKYLNKDAAR